jgi:NAD-dependent dihydropyrimidine dehydrogenase PreA subunit/nitroreductase
MLQFRIDEERCIQCGECVIECPAGVIGLDDAYPRMTSEAECFQCQHCLAVCPTAAVSILGRNPDASTVLKGNMPDPASLATLIKGRRAVRRYGEKDLAPELIDHLLEVSCHAPTGVNARSVLLTVVRERAVLNRLRDHLITCLARQRDAGELPEGLAGKFLGWTVKAWQEKGQDILFRGAPHLLITSAPAEAPCPVQDALIALATFQLLAHAHGVGTVWDGICMMALAACPEVVGRLGIPEHHTLGYAIAFGEPAVEYQRTVQRGPALVHVVKW